MHKENTPLRPIVSSTGSPTQALAKYLAENLQPIAEKMESYVKNANHFIELIGNRKMEDTDLLVSFDVKSLFTQVPIDESLRIIERDHNQPEYFVELARHCLTNIYFIYNSERYKQVEGAPMGSPLSPIIANIFMENFEKKALATTTDKPSLWLRYVDDTFVVWPHGEEKLKIFLQHLNTVHPKIEFTMEVEEKGQLPFLDVLVIKKPNGTLGHTVYRKPTHTERYLNAESHHHPAQLFSVVNTLVSRSQMLADQEHRQEELKHIRETLIHNGYDDNVVNKALRKRSRTATQVQEKSRSKAFLPYVKGTTDRISRVLRKHDIETIFTTSKKLGDTLRNYKDKIPLENQGVYEIPCGDCSSSYVGQTNRKVSVRRDEHKLAVQKREPTSSLAQHVVNTGHNINFAETRILARSTNLHSRIVREAIEIDKRPYNLNKRDDSQRLPQAWKPLLRTYTARQPDTNNTHRSLNSETSRPMTKQQQRTDHALPTTQAQTATEGTYINAQYSSQRSPIVTRSRRRCQR